STGCRPLVAPNSVRRQRPRGRPASRTRNLLWPSVFDTKQFAKRFDGTRHQVTSAAEQVTLQLSIPFFVRDRNTKLSPAQERPLPGSRRRPITENIPPAAEPGPPSEDSRMKIHEYQAKDLLARAGAGIPRGIVASSPAEAQRVFDQ